MKALEITTNVGCRNRCRYCPQEIFIRAYAEYNGSMQMSFDVYQQCIKKVPRDVLIVFAGFSEPWFNPECTRMVRYAHESGYQIRVNTSGVGMTPDDIDKIKDIPFEKFAVHLPDNEGQTAIRVDDKYLDIMKILMDSNISHSEYIFHKMNKTMKIHPALKTSFAARHIEPQLYALYTRAGQVGTSEHSRSPEKRKGLILPCDRLTLNILLPNGDVVLCCMDWAMKHVLGNLLTDSYEDLFRSHTYRQIIAGLNDPKIDVLCRYCEIAPQPETRIGKKIKSIRYWLQSRYRDIFADQRPFD